MIPPTPFRIHEITGRDSGPHLLITAGVHGDEFEGIAAIQRLIAVLDRDSLRGKVTLVPIANEQAFCRGERTADDGLDLARQCPGKADGTITARIAHALSGLIRTADYYIDLHSGGAAMKVAPLAGYMLHPDPNVLDRQRRIAQAFNLPLVWGTSHLLEGRTLSVARDAGVPAIYAEYLGSGVCSEQGVADYIQGCLNVMAEIGMRSDSAPLTSVQLIVEDSRSESGHLQVCYPSPITGLFEANVQLMQEVHAGDSIGRVIDPIGAEIHEILAKQGGVVICLAAFARTIRGNSLAVVMETEGSEISTRRR
jgi:predicted deacylase